MITVLNAQNGTTLTLHLFTSKKGLNNPLQTNILY